MVYTLYHWKGSKDILLTYLPRMQNVSSFLLLIESSPTLLEAWNTISAFWI